MPHIHDKIDFCVEVLVVYGSKVLLRKHDKYGIWLSVGGHIELDEDPNEAAVREVKEEVGLDVDLFDEGKKYTGREGWKHLIAPQFMNIHNITDTHKHVAMVFFATTKKDELTLSETEVTDGCKWFTREELNDPQYKLNDDIRDYAKVALDKLGQE